MVGILAFGSLINEPGSEIVAVRVDRKNTETPFRVEFGRSSRSRDGAPTLVPVKEGLKVKAVVFVLAPSVSKRGAEDILWRRETRQIGTGRRYNPPANPGPNDVLIKSLTPAECELIGFSAHDVILYTDFHDSGKLIDPTPQQLAELAIKSAKANAGAKGMDGISYLIAVKESNILTRLMPEYEKEILARKGASDLKQALSKIRTSM